jgi:membrane fusion protein (multidrug efflux system)
MRPLIVAGALAAAVLAGCGDGKSSTADNRKAGAPQTTPVTVTKAATRTIELTEESVGSVENVFDPRVAAEVAGRVTRVLAEVGKPVKKGDLLAEIDPVDLQIQSRSDAAEVARLETLVANQDRIVGNQQQLLQRNFISQNALDESIAQRNALREQLAGAKARLDANRNALTKTRVVAPIDGAIEERMVSPGGYVKVGDPLFRLVGKERLRAHLPFPESAAPRLRIGQKVLISSPLVPGRVVEARIDDIRPTITTTSRALDVIVGFDTDGAAFRGGGTVNAQVVVGRRENAVVVPEQSVVLRPAGKVVYLFEDGKAVQRIVQTGVRKDGMFEITQGLAGGEAVIVDGAGFLTNNAAVALAKPRAEQPSGPPAAKGGGKGAAAPKGGAS